MEETLKRIKDFLKDWKDKEILNQIDSFHRRRISKLKKNDTPIPFREGGKVVLHLIPFESYDSSKQYYLSGYEDKPEFLKEMDSMKPHQIYNFDGLLHYNLNEFVQTYSNGIIEIVDGYSISSGNPLSISNIEKEVIGNIKKYLVFQEKLGVKPPIVFYLTLLGVKGFKLNTRPNHFTKTHPINLDNLHLPKIIINKFDIVPEKILKTSFDRIWNAAGYPRSNHYDDKGNWKEK